jgi:type IV fimbrial biogenesis protein FimT
MKRRAGFTLVEALITLALIVILSTMAIPAFTTMMNNNRIAAQSNEIVAAFHLARSEAVRRGVAVSVNPLGGSWDTGLQIQLVSTGEVLRVVEPLTNTSIAGTVANYTYAATGRVNTAGSFTLCKSDATGRVINISAIGRPNVTTISCPAG